MKITISVSGKLPQGAVGGAGGGGGGGEGGGRGAGGGWETPRAPGPGVLPRGPRPARPAPSRRVAPPPLAALSLRRHQDSGGRSPSAKGQPEEILTCHQPSSMPSTPHFGLACQFLQPGSPMSSL